MVFSGEDKHWVCEEMRSDASAVLLSMEENAGRQAQITAATTHSLVPYSALTNRLALALSMLLPLGGTLLGKHDATSLGSVVH